MNDNKKLKFKSSFMLLLTAVIWGFAFVAQRVGTASLGGFSFNGIRNIIGGAVLLPVIFIMKKKGRLEKALTPEGFTGGILCGVCLFAASSFQQFGIMKTTVGKASFITALYVVIVPLMQTFIFRKKMSGKLILSVIIAVIGMYLLCINEGFTIGEGDILILICAFVFSVHILTIDHFSPLADGVVIACIQFFTAGILSTVCMFIFETPEIGNFVSSWIPILYAGVLSCGVAYTLQVVYQKNIDPTAASLILSLESIFGAIGGWLILGQGLSPREMIGCGLTFAAVILAQI